MIEESQTMLVLIGSEMVARFLWPRLFLLAGFGTKRAFKQQFRASDQTIALHSSTILPITPPSPSSCLSNDLAQPASRVFDGRVIAVPVGRLHDHHFGVLWRLWVANDGQSPTSDITREDDATGNASFHAIENDRR